MRLIRGSRLGDTRLEQLFRKQRSYLSVKSTIPRRRAMSSFFLRARSLLFFFSVYRLSSRLDIRQQWYYSVEPFKRTYRCLR